MNFQKLSVLTILTLSCLIGCANTASGVKEDTTANAKETSGTANDLAAKVGEAGRDANAAIMLTPKVSAAIHDDQRSEDSKNSVKVSSTEEKVILEGTVVSEERKAKAGELALKAMRENNAKQTLENKLVVNP